jgi:hypothetical protein
VSLLPSVGIRRFSHEVGNLWTSLADYYIRLGVCKLRKRDRVIRVFRVVTGNVIDNTVLPNFFGILMYVHAHLRLQQMRITYAHNQVTSTRLVTCTKKVSTQSVQCGIFRLFSTRIRNMRYISGKFGVLGLLGSFV